jgi:hypothetical protein
MSYYAFAPFLRHENHSFTLFGLAVQRFGTLLEFAAQAAPEWSFKEWPGQSLSFGSFRCSAHGLRMRRKGVMFGKLGGIYLPNDCSELGCFGTGGALDSEAGTEGPRE